MTKRIHHVGLAVEKIEPVAEFWEEILGGKMLDYEMETPEFFSRMMQVGQGVFELLEPRGENGLIEKFLKSRGEGIHHVSMVVDDVKEVIKTCEEKGVKMMWNRFIHPKSSHGVLIEIIDKSEAGG